MLSFQNVLSGLFSQNIIIINADGFVFFSLSTTDCSPLQGVSDVSSFHCLYLNKEITAEQDVSDLVTD